MLEDKLETLANQIGQFGLAAALITFGAMAGQFTWHTLVQEGRPWDWAMLSTYLKYAITAITILVRTPSTFFRGTERGERERERERGREREREGGREGGRFHPPPPLSVSSVFLSPLCVSLPWPFGWACAFLCLHDSPPSCSFPPSLHISVSVQARCSDRQPTSQHAVHSLR